MDTITITIKNVDVELHWRDNVGVGYAVHEVSTEDLHDGIAKGPCDGEVFLFRGRQYQLGQHDYEDGDGTTTCIAEIYEYDDDD